MKGPDLRTLLWTIVGVITAVLLPVLAATVTGDFSAASAGPGIPPWIRKAATLLLFAVLAGLVSLAIYQSNNPDKPLPWFTAFLVGFGWEAAIEKFLGPPTD